MADNPAYITTPIYYVNGLPHIGHAYTTIAADVYARWQRVRGRQVFFLTGTDEHGQKVMQTAQKRGMSPKVHCDDMVTHWVAMWERLNIQHDRFIRTTDADHEAVVTAVMQKLFDKGLIYKRDYEGWYSVTDEIFVTEKDVEAGKYDRDTLQKISETNYWFVMSRYQQQLIDHINDNPGFIRPNSRRNEVLGFLRKPLSDLCISRPRSRMEWGIELPFDSDYVTYVWFDALLNYLTGIGYHPDPAIAGDWQKWWPATFQLLGKDILTTHSVYWSTMLMAMEIPLADCLFAHGWWTSADGDKMSKSQGNAIDIALLEREFGADPCRYFFLREKSMGGDGGFSYAGFLTRYNADLANDLGNLAHRGLSMTDKWLGGVVPELSGLEPIDNELRRTAAVAIRGYREHMDELAFSRALESLWIMVKAANKYIEQTQPWTLNKNGERQRLATVKRHVLEVCYAAAACMLPVTPGKANELLAKLGRTEEQASAWLLELIEQSAGESIALQSLHTGDAVRVGDPLFPRIREMPKAIAELFDDQPTKAKQKKQKKPPKKKKRPAPPAEIEFDDFAKLDLRVGKVISVDKHPKADRLLVLQVDIAEANPRQIVAGVAGRFTPDELVGRTVVVVANLKPADLRGVQSQGMLLAAGDAEVVDLVGVNAPPGEVVR